MDTATAARERMRALGLWGPGRSRPEDVVRMLLAMQAQEHAYAKWSVAQRTQSATEADVDAALGEGRILRTHVLRPTWHYVAAEDLRWLMALSGPRVNAVNATRYRKLGLEPSVLSASDALIARALAHHGQLTRRELGAVLEGGGLAPEGQRLPHMLMHAELGSVVTSGPARGREHTYVLFDERVPAGAPLSREKALAELAARYFQSRGPATVQDFTWWSGLTAADARLGLEAAAGGLERIEAGDRVHWRGTRRRGTPRRPRVDLVQCYDEVVISYSRTRDVLHTPAVSFTVPGSVDGYSHIALLDGRLAGHWRVRRERGTSHVETRLRVATDPAVERAMADAVARFRAFTKGVCTLHT